MQRTKYLSLVAVFAAASGALTELHVMFPFPLLPFLEFDMAEIPDMVAFLLLGPEGGLLVTLIHCLLLYTLGAFTVFSPVMKFLAEASMYAGILIARRLSSRTFALAAGAISSRVIIMLFVNFALFYIIMPNIYLPTANLAMSILHLSGLSPVEIAMLLVGITGLFNAIAGAITFGVGYPIARKLSSALAPALR
ncbi:MAG: hypothetical protein ACP5LW_00515 [Nitrososphaeria archaeon]